MEHLALLPAYLRRHLTDEQIAQLGDVPADELSLRSWPR